MRYTGFMKTNHIKQIIRPTLKDQVYDSLKKAIVTLEFKPGEKLSDKKLAEQFAVSRTPVREALKRLEDEGLVISLPGSSTRVTELVEEEAKHAFTVVAALHSLATKLAVPKMVEQDFEKLALNNHLLIEALEKKDGNQAIEADEYFHQVFLTIAGNIEIVRALKRINPKIQRLTIMKFDSVDSMTSINQHKEIIAACKKGKAELAADLVEENWLTLGRLLSDGN